MAARAQLSSVQIVALCELAPGSLDSLLAEESLVWRNRLDWDFDQSAEMIRRFADRKGLDGVAAVVGDVAVGYSYFVAEGEKGLIGDLFVSQAFSSAVLEHRLLAAVVEQLTNVWSCKRVESQLLLHDFPRAGSISESKIVSSFVRKFMALQMAANALAPRALPDHIVVEPFASHHQEDAARLIAECYVGHVDALINDQYRGIPGARKFLRNIVQYPGCGVFCEPSSLVARDLHSGRLVAISLASLVSASVGHITQVCVSPRLRQTGLGFELLRRTISQLGESGCHRVSLTVTARNKEACRLYERMGFCEIHSYCALVWENRPGWFGKRFLNQGSI